MRPGETPEERLRDALRARAVEVEPAPDALARIRMRTGERRRNGWAMTGAAAAVAAAIAAGVVVFAPQRGPQLEPQPAATGSVAVPPSAGPSPSAAGSTPPANVQLPVYFIRNGMLYREFHAVPLTADSDAERIAAAVRESLTGEARDPDYGTAWPPGITVHGVVIDGRSVTVDLGDVGTDARDGARALAVQQLVYTVAAASTYTSIRKAEAIRVVVDGAPVAKLWGSVDAGGPLRQAPMADVQGPVWVIDPQQDQQAGRSFVVYLAGVVHEGTVQLRIRGTGGKVVFERTVQLSAGAPALGEARVPVTLPPGRYTVESWYVSMKDGSVQAVDDHEFTVG
ncbi:GerMN domain-containing protein [Dactylosporangium sp. AC04546]|uniref:GerMN domain-containing protein n=1 Tax=Dactylosporangium sp. AC04546 TaxID=2862460 RepID=UPI001EE132F6|nr:GerMN domain-containing protein [Dactylosporangium sp. AC04546]WVK81663.1 GerMN domain-containing protein [Dactylosporangium sp. AC04546]